MANLDGIFVDPKLEENTELEGAMKLEICQEVFCQ